LVLDAAREGFEEFAEGHKLGLGALAPSAAEHAVGVAGMSSTTAAIEVAHRGKWCIGAGGAQGLHALTGAARRGLHALPLGFPVLDLIVVFIAGDIFDGGREFENAGFAADLAPEGLGEDKELVCGQLSEVTGGELGFYFLELLAKVLHAAFAGGEPFFLELLDVDGALVLDFELKFAAPLDEGGFGDVQLLGNPREAAAFRAKEDESLLGLDVVHRTF
jgi:hypothetical protein